MAIIPTIKIKHPTKAGAFAIINECDFNPDEHELFVEATAEEKEELTDKVAELEAELKRMKESAPADETAPAEDAPEAPAKNTPKAPAKPKTKRKTTVRKANAPTTGA